MANQNIGILHPGSMGIFVASSAQNSGNTVYWVSEGRSPQTRARAETYHLRESKSLAKLVADCSVIVSVCPPDSAEQVASQVAAHSFKGLYIDANAISPQRAIRIGHIMHDGGAQFVDGGIIGYPNWESKNAWLYLSGEHANMAASLFASGPIQPRVVAGDIGKASALKMCYSAYAKGTTALLSAVLGAAQSLSVLAELQAQWTMDASGLAEQAPRKATQVTQKAWRFAGEMHEIVETFQDAGLPGEFHLGAEEIYRRMAQFKDAAFTPSLDEVLHALIQPRQK
jgi:3-hydroxyisobutyrate dehydrogenase-like beta-hydroxyacid dehydrogenase